jgi:antitoxin component of MazEF toxin-antitoxin module
MATTTLRKWGGATAVSLPKAVLAMLDLRPGSEVAVSVRGKTIVLAPAHRRPTLAQLEKEQRALERARGKSPADAQWLDGPARGKEAL